MSRYEWISFYISSEEMNELTHSHESFAVAKLAHLMNKSETALDEFNKQICPLFMFIWGATLGCYMASNYQFWCFVIPESIVILCMVEIVFHLQYKSKLPVSIDVESEINQKQDKVLIADSLSQFGDFDNHSTTSMENESKIQWDDFALDNSAHKDSHLRRYRNRNRTWSYISVPKEPHHETKVEVIRNSMFNQSISHNYVDYYEI